MPKSGRPVFGHLLYLGIQITSSEIRTIFFQVQDLRDSCGEPVPLALLLKLRPNPARTLASGLGGQGHWRGEDLFPQPANGLPPRFGHSQAVHTQGRTPGLAFKTAV